MPDPLKKVVPGERMRLGATAYNAMIDAANATLADRRDLTGAPLDRPAERLTLKVRNDTEDTIEIGGVVQLGDPLIDAAGNLSEFRRWLNFAGVSPTGAGQPFAILLEPLKADRIGNAAATGIVAAQVDITSASHGYCSPAVGVTANLVSGATGVAEIVHKPSGTGVKWCYVRLGGDEPAGAGLGVSNVCVAKASSVDVVASPVTINSTSYTLVLTQTLVLAKATKVDTSLHLYWDGAGAAASGNKFEAILKVDGVAETQAAVWRASSADDMGHVSQRWYKSLTADSHTLEVYAKRTAGAGVESVQIGVNTDLVSVAETVITKETTSASGTVVCTDDPAGCCPISSGTGGGTSYQASGCSVSGATGLTIPGVTVAPDEMLIVDFGSSLMPGGDPTATFNGHAMVMHTNGSEATTAHPVDIFAFYYLCGIAETGDVVITWPTGTVHCAARAVRIPKCTNAPYGTSGGNGAGTTPITGTLGGSNLLAGYVHAAFIMSAPSSVSPWASPFNGEAADLDFCTDYRLATGGTVAQNESQTFTAELEIVIPQAWAGYEIYLLGGAGGGGGGGGGGSYQSCGDPPGNVAKRFTLSGLSGAALPAFGVSLPCSAISGTYTFDDATLYPGAPCSWIAPTGVMHSGMELVFKMFYSSSGAIVITLSVGSPPTCYPVATWTGSGTLSTTAATQFNFLGTSTPDCVGSCPAIPSTMEVAPL